MQSEIFLNGKKYISTKKATEIIELDEEHIKDLCREEKIDFTKVEGEYFVELETLFEYKNKTNKPMILPIRALSTAVLAILLIGAGYFAGDIVKQVGEAGDTIFSVIKNTKEITYKVGAEKRDLFKTQILDNSDDSPIKEIKDSKNVKTIDTYTQDFLNYLEGLRNRIVSDSSSLRGTKQSINNLALAVYETASPVEQFAIVWYRTVNSVFARSVGNRSDEAIQNEDDVDRFTIVREDEVSQSETSSDSSDSSVIARNEAIQNSTTPLETTTVSDSLSLTGQVREIIKEVVVERVIQTSGITLEDLQKLNNELRSEIYKLSSATNSQITNTYQVISATNNIDNLGGVTIYDSNITNSNISGTTLSFTNGTVDTLSVTGTGTTTFAGALEVNGAGIELPDGFIITGSNSLSKWTSNGSAIYYNTGYVGIGTSTPSDTFSINGATYLAPISAPAVTTDRLYNISNDLYWGGNLLAGSAVGNWTSNGTDVWRASGNVGIGTTTPYAKLSVAGDIVADYFNATSTTATSTFVGAVGIGGGTVTNGSKLTINGLVSQTGLGYSTYFGHEAGRIDDLSNNYNTGFGYQSLYSNTTGYNNSGLGFSSLRSNTTGYSNTASGNSSLTSNTSGYLNTASGYISLQNNTSGYRNTASGAGSLYNNTNGHDNTVSGYYAMSSNSAGNYNAAFGYDSLGSNTTGNNNTALGSGTATLSNGSNNIFVGYQAGNNLTSGSSNILLGYDIDAQSATGSSQLSIGNLIFGTGGFGTGTTVGVGNVGIGTTSPLAKLSVKGAGTTTGINFQTTNSANTPLVTVLDSGNVGIGTTSPNYKLTVNGTVGFNALPNDGTGYYLCAKTGTGELATSTTACGASSERFKTNINDLTYGLDTVLQLRPVSFNWKSDFINSSSTQIGFIAEEVNSLIPEVIGHDDKGTIMNLDYPKLTSVLVNAIKEIWNKVTENALNILANKNEIESLKQRVTELENLLQANAVDSGLNTSTTIEFSVPPTITIIGNNPAIVEINSIYADLGATAVDSQGHSLIVDTIDADKVDTTIAGEYTVTYTTFDGTNTSTTTRRVIVEDPTPLETTTVSDSLPLTGQATPLETTTASSSLPLTGEPVIEPIATTTEPVI